MRSSQLFAIAFVVCSATANAQPKCSIGTRAALSEIACEVSAALTAAPAGMLVVAGPVQSDVELRDARELGRRLASIVAGALGRDARAASETAELLRARGMARQAGTLLHLSVEVARGELRVTADVHRARVGFWDRVREQRPAPSLHAFASRRVDPELRSFFAPVPLVVSRVDKAKTEEREPVALACDDIDGDGALELLLVGRRRLATGRLRRGRWQTIAAAAWSELSPVAQSPLREPIAAALPRDGGVDVGLSDRAQAVRLDGRLRAIEKWGRRIPWGPGGCARFAGLSLAPGVEACAERDEKPALAAFGERTDAVAGALIVTRSGQARRVRVGRLFNEAVAVLRDDAGKTARVAGIGAQLAVSDLDEDGQPELVSGSDSVSRGGDALVVHTWYDDGSVRERFRIGVPGGVHAVTTCPREGEGMKAIALASPSEVWVVR